MPAAMLIVRNNSAGGGNIRFEAQADFAGRMGRSDRVVSQAGVPMVMTRTDLTASNFETFVCDAYKFLMDYYQTGDKVYILGFSRGAYTARAVAGMVQKVCPGRR